MKQCSKTYFDTIFLARPSLCCSETAVKIDSKIYYHIILLFNLQVGGLGDVVTGLGKALQKRGHLVEIVLPKYDCMKDDMIRDLRVCL